MRAQTRKVDEPLTKVGRTESGALAGLRGPAAPHRLCPECGAQSEGPWENPILAVAKKLFGYSGEITGGLCLCDPCADIVEARLTGQSQGPRYVASLPLEFQQATLGNYLALDGNQVGVDAALAFVSPDATHDLYLCGPVGVGKTRLAASIANEVFRVLRRSVLFKRVPALMLELHESMDSNHPAHLTDYAAPDLLVLDDVGVEKGSEFSRRTLQTLYDMRRDAGRRTIWTSNLDLEQLSTFLQDDRLPSRIAGGCEIVWVDGKDRRIERVTAV